MARYTIPNMYSAKQKLYRDWQILQKVVWPLTFLRWMDWQIVCYWSVTLQKLKMGTSLESLQNPMFVTLNVAFRITFLQLLYNK